MKLKAPTRSNYSRYGQLCDQTFYHDSTPVEHPIQDPPKPMKKPKLSTSGFTSISREKKGNLHYFICQPKEEFSYHPNHSFDKKRLPSWSFSKT